MAALSSTDRSPKKGPRRMRPHMDFTPMVDLGFLLITFFMLSTTLAKPTVMPLVMPDQSGTPEPIKQSKALTILLGADNKVYWYEGQELEKMDSTGFERDGLRALILNKMKKVQEQWGLQTYQDQKSGDTKEGSHLNVIIKPSKNAHYRNLVDALDEMNICGVRYYCIVDPNQEELNEMR